MSDRLLRCLRWDAEGEERLRNLDGAGWARLLSVVELRGGAGLLVRRLQLARIHAPDSVAAILHRSVMAVAARNLAGQRALAQAVRAAGRPALLLKGVDVAGRLYGNLGQRTMGDVDVLVHAEDVDAYHTVLTTAGFGGGTPPDPALLASNRHHHLVYIRHGCLPVELHWRLADSGDDAMVDLDGIWKRAQPHALAPGARIMAAEDLFLYLCLHLKHHTFDVSLVQLWDLAEFLRAMQPDWETVWQRARDWRLTEAVLLSLYLLQENLGVGSDQLDSWAPPEVISAHLPDVLPQLGRYPSQDQVSGHRIALLLSDQASWREWMIAVREGVLLPRTELRAIYGSPRDGLFRDVISYLQHGRHLLRIKGQVLFKWLRGDHNVRSHLDRLAVLRRYLSGPR